MKRYRKTTGIKGLKFYMCGEYSPLNGLPHFHGIIFGHDFNDKTYWKTTPSGEKIYRSKLLEQIWPFGFSSTGAATFKSAAYIARYCMAKITGKLAEEHYRRIDPETGEIYQIKPEYNRMSNQGGIGKGWFERYHGDVYPHDYVVINGHESRPPKYYDVLLERKAPDTFDQLKAERALNTLKYAMDNTDERLRVREEVARAKTQSLNRGKF